MTRQLYRCLHYSAPTDAAKDDLHRALLAAKRVAPDLALILDGTFASTIERVRDLDRDAAGNVLDRVRAMFDAVARLGGTPEPRRWGASPKAVRGR